MSTFYEAGGIVMAARERNLVNLDAMIPRADLLGETPEVNIASNRSIRISDLEECAFYDQFRKPDFQRETANWTPRQVTDLIKTFRDQDIIPSIIFWQNGPHIFVIDGAHRLSALVAWTRDDYGAGDLSAKLFKRAIPAQQLAMDEETRRLVNDEVGRYEDYRARVNIFGLKELSAQWIEKSTSLQAGEAFIRINQSGTAIDQLEVRILRNPRAALSIATRAVTRRGAGHAYWNHFRSQDARADAPRLGKEIYELLFHPPLKTPIKTTEVPMAGLEYGGHVVRLAFDVVALANDLKIPDSTRRNPRREVLPGDDIGDETVRYLARTKSALERVLSMDPSSFGLHPGLYFYSGGGAFQSASLLNMIAWLKHLEKRNALDDFRRVRGRFEDLILRHPVIAKPPTHKLGTGKRTRPAMIALFDHLLKLLSDEPDPEKVWGLLGEDYPYLVRDEDEENEEAAKGAPGERFSPKTKSAVTLDGLDAVPRCGLCGGLLHPNGKVLDHKNKRAAGGSSAKSNARYVHPVCNSMRDKDEAR